MDKISCIIKRNKKTCNKGISLFSLFNTFIQIKTHLTLQNHYLKNKVTVVPVFTSLWEADFKTSLSLLIFPFKKHFWGWRLMFPILMEILVKTRKTLYLSLAAVICCILHESKELTRKILIDSNINEDKICLNGKRNCQNLHALNEWRW